LLKKTIIALVCFLAVVLGVVVNLSHKADFTTLDGTDYRWKGLQGNWLVVNYFAEWCAPCLREIPELNEFYAVNKDQLAMFAVSFDALSHAQLSELQKKYNIQFPVVEFLGKDTPMARPKNLPATFIIAPDGRVAKQLLGEQSAESLKAALNLLKGL
jgi:thiol-disulfide isomerase/thioredoxin